MLLTVCAWGWVQSAAAAATVGVSRLLRWVLVRLFGWWWAAEWVRLSAVKRERKRERQRVRENIETPQIKCDNKETNVCRNESGFVPQNILVLRKCVVVKNISCDFIQRCLPNQWYLYV